MAVCMSAAKVALPAFNGTLGKVPAKRKRKKAI
jgi:hypothetical protein